MKVTSLIENTRKNDGLISEHGLSLLIETGDKRILFDFGRSGRFIDNAEKLGIDLNRLDAAILSHGHYDHANGLKRFLEHNKTAKVLASKDVFKDYYHGKKYIGVDEDLKNSDRFVFTDDDYKISENIFLMNCNDKDRLYPNDSGGFFVKKGENFVPDTFLHEQYLLVEEDGKRILFTGCSHKGILNLVEWLRPDVLIGGFHLMGLNTETEEGIKRITEVGRKLNDYNTVFYTCHCTGESAYKLLKPVMGENLNYLSTGETITI